MRRVLELALMVVAAVGSVSEAGGGFDQAIDAVSTRVVKVYGLKAGLSAGYGTGTLISGDGLVVTTFSLLLDSENLRVVTHDGTVYGADMLDMSEELQLALLQMKPRSEYDRRGNRIVGDPIGADTFTYFTPGDSHAMYPGAWVLAAGNPFKVSQGAEPISVTVGVFSTRTHLDARRKTRDFPYRGEVLVIDAITSNPGAPGGPLVNLDGEWIGLVGRVVESKRTHTNLNYALPVETVMDYVRSVTEQGSEEDVATIEKVEPYHGIKLFEMGYQKNLVYVDRVKRRSPAKKAGLRKDDLIVSIAGRSVRDSQTFHAIMREYKPGDKVDIVVIRDEKLHNLSLIPEEPRE